MVDSSLQMFKRGEAERLTELLGCCLGHSGVAKSESTFLCVFPMWIFKPFSDLKLFSHWSHLKTFFTVSSLGARVTSMKSAVHERGSDFFFFRNSALRLAFLLIAEGLFLGSWGKAALLGVQGERKGGANGDREGEGLVLAGQRLAEIHALGGQRRIHWSHFLVYLNQENEGASKRYMLLLWLLTTQDLWLNLVIIVVILLFSEMNQKCTPCWAGRKAVCRFIPLLLSLLLLLLLLLYPCVKCACLVGRLNARLTDMRCPLSLVTESSGRIHYIHAWPLLKIHSDSKWDRAGFTDFMAVWISTGWNHWRWPVCKIGWKILCFHRVANPLQCAWQAGLRIIMQSFATARPKLKSL